MNNILLYDGCYGMFGDLAANATIKNIAFNSFIRYNTDNTISTEYLDGGAFTSVMFGGANDANASLELSNVYISGVDNLRATVLFNSFNRTTPAESVKLTFNNV
jgi:hypothetical protein